MLQKQKINDLKIFIFLIEKSPRSEKGISLTDPLILCNKHNTLVFFLHFFSNFSPLLSGKLIGVHAMKVSTVKETFKSSVNSFHVIIFYCGPWDDKEYMYEIGHNLLDQIEYTTQDGAILYKSDLADDLPFRSRAILNKTLKYNPKYIITVPKR